VVSALLCALPAHAPAQTGSNYDPPPVSYTEPDLGPEPPPPPPPDPPFWRQVDYSDPANLVKIALLLGSIVIARRIFREMTGE
jgi:hypothetical protein